MTEQMTKGILFVLGTMVSGVGVSMLILGIKILWEL
jgi:hypothetical protein